MSCSVSFMTDRAGFEAHNHTLCRGKPIYAVGTAMSIMSFFSQASFDPQKTDILAAAFDIAWERLRNSGSPLTEANAASASREILAKNIIAVAQMGDCDANRLVEAALSRLAIDPDGHLLAAKGVPSP
jgi:hypothetical protein